MTIEDRPIDPYATPHAPKSKGGPMLRIMILAVLLAGTAVGWSYFSSQSSEGLTPPETEQVAIETPQLMADASGVTAPEAIPQAVPVSPAPPARAPAQRAAPRSVAPAANVEPTPVPPPTTTTADPGVAPVDQPQQM